MAWIDRLIMCLLALVLLAPLPSCNTVQGVGQDVQQAGNAISRTASQTREELRR